MTAKDPQGCMPTCACAISSPATALQLPRRRALLGALAAWCALPSASAQDDLLDPSKLGTSSKSSSSGSPASAPGVGHAPQDPARGRDMAGSVVVALDGLARAAASRSEDIARLDKEAADLVARLSKYNADKAAKLDEYRQGLFCSGCGKTKSEILAVGDTFPHPGQSVIRATQAQIAAKEREMQAPIDRAVRELEGNRTKRKALGQELDEIFVQVNAGLNLWNTSLAFEKNQLQWALQDAEERYRRERRKLEDSINAPKAAAKTASQAGAADPKARQRLQGSLDQLDSKFRSEQGRGKTALGRAAAHAERERVLLNEFLARGKLAQLTTLLATIAYPSPSADFVDLGGKFRMGRFNPEGHGEILPSVESFINAFRQIPGFGGLGATPPATRAGNKVDDTVKDLLNCLPEDGGKCKAQK